MFHNKCGKGMCTPAMIGKILLIIGGINWGLVGVGMFLDMNLNIVNLILGGMPTVEGIVYVLVGVSAVMKIIGCKCKSCSSCTCTADAGTKTGESMM